jgi:hypothetical protein
VAGSSPFANQTSRGHDGSPRVSRAGPSCNAQDAPPLLLRREQGRCAGRPGPRQSGRGGVAPGRRHEAGATPRASDNSFTLSTANRPPRAGWRRRRLPGVVRRDRPMPPTSPPCCSAGRRGSETVGPAEPTQCHLLPTPCQDRVGRPGHARGPAGLRRALLSQHCPTHQTTQRAEGVPDRARGLIPTRHGASVRRLTRPGD